MNSFRAFHVSIPLQRTEKHILSDIGEGVKEVQIIQWFVEEGATVEEWAPLCEVQSDKASVEITSKYGGVIKKLLYERDAVVQVGDAMLEIEVEGEDDSVENKEDGGESDDRQSADEHDEQEKLPPNPQLEKPIKEASDVASTPKSSGKHANLATPAVRGLLKEHKLVITDIEGTGKDGRVLKEDVHRHLELGKQQPATKRSTSAAAEVSATDIKQSEDLQNLTPIQSAMFKSMTKALSIPHFLYSDTVDVSNLSAMRRKLNEGSGSTDAAKLSYMPFVIKAVSLALHKFPILNARLDTSDSSKPRLLMRSHHNICVAMDTPNGLLVPVIKNANVRTIASIAQELGRLAEAGRAGRLTNEDLTGGTITVSNIGNIGGGVLAPVIVEGQLAIMGIGKIRPTPVFADDGSIRKADIMTMSWSADHRVVDGATMARMATVVQKYLEQPESMIVDMQ